MMKAAAAAVIALTAIPLLGGAGTLGSTFTLFAFETGYTPLSPNEGSPDVGFQFLQAIPEPDPSSNPHFRTRLHVLELKSAEPDATNRPDDAQ